MTSKEKQKCPTCGYTEKDAKLHMDHHLCKNAGNAPWEKRGQNAAESLPAENGVSKFFGTWPGGETDGDLLGALDEIRKPTGPVTVPGEAKEKERCEHGVWLADYCYKCAEPKPTPSAEPTVDYRSRTRDHEGNPLKLNQYGFTAAEWDEFVQQATDLHDKLMAAEGDWDQESHEIIQSLVKRKQELLAQNKPQPDSSSIPVRPKYRFERHGHASGRAMATFWESDILHYFSQVEALWKDSSSISTEHTFEEWLADATIAAAKLVDALAEAGEGEASAISTLADKVHIRLLQMGAAKGLK